MPPGPAPGIFAALRTRRATVLALVLVHALLVLSAAALVLGLSGKAAASALAGAGVLLFAALSTAAAVALVRRLRLLSAALERAQRQSTVGLVTAGFAHEMKNALTVVHGFAELARTAAERSQTEAKVVRYLRELEDETRRTVGQLQGFLEYAGAEAQPRRPREVNELVREALTMIRPMARMKELVLEEQLGAPPDVQCDAFAVRQVLLNLLLNALEFARGRIVVSSGADGAFAEVRIADDGPGVPERDRARIFRRFVTTRPGGSGLGLATSREIAIAHGGTLELAETPGGGATFLLRLPAA